MSEGLFFKTTARLMMGFSSFEMCMHTSTDAKCTVFCLVIKLKSKFLVFKYRNIK